MKRTPITLFGALLFLAWLMPAQATPVYVDAAWLEQRLDDPSIVLVDMATDQTQYQRFHIPGAVYMPFGALVQRQRSGVTLRVPDQRLYQVLGFFGDDMGGLNAGRLFWELERIGHEKVSVLEGGLVDWIQSGRKIEAKPNEAKRVTYTPKSGKGRANEARNTTATRATSAAATSPARSSGLGTRPCSSITASSPPRSPS
jgi:thiosulfate/3-mercaptopyruvate sulfurtransferase